MSSSFRRTACRQQAMHVGIRQSSVERFTAGFHVQKQSRHRHCARVTLLTVSLECLLSLPFFCLALYGADKGFFSLQTNQCVWKSTTLTTGYVSRWNSLLSTITVAWKQSGGPRDSQQPQHPWHITRSGWARIWQNCSRMSHKQNDASWGRSNAQKQKVS